MIENVSYELQTTNHNLIALGIAVENEGENTRNQLLDDTNALDNQLENGQAQTKQLKTDSTNAVVNQLANNQSQTANMVTNGINAVGNQPVNNQQAVVTRGQLFQHLYDQNMRGF